MWRPRTQDIRQRGEGPYQMQAKVDQIKMSAPENHTIYTIGHSTRDLDEFLGMLESFAVRQLVDIRRFPMSRKYPHFNIDSLRAALEARGMAYAHLEDLGGRRKALPDSKNHRWRSASFRGYADYMETKTFAQAASELERIASQQTTAYMCSEAVWWRCHRSMVSDFLKAKGWRVLHILSLSKLEEHPYTSPASVSDGKVSYR